MFTYGNSRCPGKLVRWLLALALVPQLAASAWSATTSTKGAPPAVTRSEVLAGRSVAPMLREQSGAALLAAEERYGDLVAKGGWSKLAKAGLKKGATGPAVAQLNKRLWVEGYLRSEATQGEFAEVFTTATQDALQRFQVNHGLAANGILDVNTLAALNVSAKVRLQTIRANIPRLQVYEQGLGNRYLVVNVPSQQIEAVNNGRVYSRHNAIVGRPERPTPVVMTSVAEVKFNPYWNAPASIVERDIIPKISSGSRWLEDMNMKVFEGVGGPEIDPGDVDWDSAIVDNYHFRQEPGPENAMATAKIEFLSPFGIYLHDTPEKQLFKSGRRFYSSGCVRVEKIDVLLEWLLNGQDGFGSSRIAAMAETLERLDVKVNVQPQLRVVYLTAWPVGNTVAFRNDVYDLDTSGFTVGQPMPVGEESPEGLRYTVKPIPRLAREVEDSGGFWSFGKSANKKDSNKPVRTPNLYGDEDIEYKTVMKNGVFLKTPVKPRSPNAAKKGFVEKVKSADIKEKKKPRKYFWSNNTPKPAKAEKPVKSVGAKKKPARAEGNKIIASTATNKLVAKKTAAVAAKKPTDPKTVNSATAQKCVADATGKFAKGCPVTPAKAKTAAKASEPPSAAN